MDIVDVVSNILFGQNAFKVDAPLKRDFNETTQIKQNESSLTTIKNSSKIKDFTTKKQFNKQLVSFFLKFKLIK